jgi:hypothetical protein
MYLSKKQILEAQDRRYVVVDVPEWSGKVRLVSLNADQSLKLERLIKKAEKEDSEVNPLASMLVYSIVDEQGQQIFTSAEDVKGLGEKDPAVLVRLIEAMKTLNKKDDDKGNSQANQRADSPSDSASR